MTERWRRQAGLLGRALRPGYELRARAINPHVGYQYSVSADVLADIGYNYPEPPVTRLVGIPVVEVEAPPDTLVLEPTP